MEELFKSWGKFVEENQKSQEVVGELSKLYIILHENVRQTILKSTVDFKYNPNQDCRKHLSTILDLLKRLNNPQDTYLNNVSPNIISKFQEQLHELSDQVQQLMKSHTFAKEINVAQLQAIKSANERQEFGLKDELKKSQQRKMRSRSGKRSSRPGTNDTGRTHNLIDEFAEYKQTFLSKRQKLLNDMEGHVERKGTQLSFSNKYKGTNLQDYFKKRQQLLNLQIADQYTQRVMHEHDRPAPKVQQHVSEDFQNKLFSEFKIKTKYMKKQVRENILNALVDVKMKLLEEYHSSNMKILKEGNPDTLVALVPQKHHRSQTTIAPQRKKYTTSASTLQSPQHPSSLPSKQPQREVSLNKYPMAMKSCRPFVYDKGWSESLEDQYRKNMREKFEEGRVPN